MGVGLNAGGRPGQKRMAVDAGVGKRGWSDPGNKYAFKAKR